MMKTFGNVVSICALMMEVELAAVVAAVSCGAGRLVGDLNYMETLTR